MKHTSSYGPMIVSIVSSIHPDITRCHIPDFSEGMVVFGTRVVLGLLGMELVTIQHHIHETSSIYSSRLSAQ